MELKNTVFATEKQNPSKKRFYLPCFSVIGTSAKLCIGSPYVFFGANLRIRQQQAENTITLKRLKEKTSNLDLRWGTYESFLVQILVAISHVIRVFEPKTEMPIRGSNTSSSKTNRTRGIKVLNLEATGHAVSASKNKS